MNLNNNFKNIIGLKSDQEHMSENQISISLIVKEVSQFLSFNFRIQNGRHLLTKP